MNHIEKLKQSIQFITEQRPSYQSILDFYSRVFIIQEQRLQNIQVPAIDIEPDVLAIKQKNGLPLVDPSEFTIDLPSAVRAFKEICELAARHAPGISFHAQFLKKAISDQSIDPASFFTAVLNHDTAGLQDLSTLLDVPVQQLFLLGHLSITPSIRACAQQLEPYLEKSDTLQHKDCPICGNGPDLSFLDLDGRQHLNCSFCAHQWQIKRVGCIFCRNTESQMQSYFFNETEKEYRVNVCDNCRQFVKQVDLRQMDREFFPDLEQVATLHLEIQAREKGYQNDRIDENPGCY